MKNTLLLLTMISVMSLTACSHENPMNKKSPEETVEFIKKASLYASDKMDVKGSKSVKELEYHDCMYNQFINKTFCPKFYEYMIEYAKKSGSDFSSLTIEDLQDKESYEKIDRLYFSSVIKTVRVSHPKKGLF